MLLIAFKSRKSTVFRQRCSYIWKILCEKSKGLIKIKICINVKKYRKLQTKKRHTQKFSSKKVNKYTRPGPKQVRQYIFRIYENFGNPVILCTLYEYGIQQSELLRRLSCQKSLNILCLKVNTSNIACFLLAQLHLNTVLGNCQLTDKINVIKGIYVYWGNKNKKMISLVSFLL